MAPDGTAAARPAASEPAVAVGRGNVGRIPIRNLWLLMLYASRLYRELPPARRVTVEDNPDDIPDLVAQLLTRAVERRLRRNLSFAFQETGADLRRVRGRIDLLRTERRHLLRRGRVACRYEELTVDTPRNRTYGPRRSSWSRWSARRTWLPGAAPRTPAWRPPA